jgi:alpha-beta hydrolase superfamily lysophospholipase
MKISFGKKKIRVILRWVFWVLLIQFVLINITGAIYAYHLTYFYDAPAFRNRPAPQNIFVKTWHLFRGPEYFRLREKGIPDYPYRGVTLYTKDSIAIAGWYIPADSSKGTVLLLHGLGGNMETILKVAYSFHEMKYSIMMIDYRAHGSSGGHVFTFGARETEEVKLAYDYVVSTGERNIFMYGFSMGAVLAAKTIYDYGLKPSGLIMDASFATLRDHFRARARILGFPSEPFATLVTFWSGVERGFNGFRLSACRYVEKVDCPVLLEFGEMDKLVLRSETECIFKHIRSPQKKLVEYDDVGHYIYVEVDPIKWEREVNNFLNVWK